MTRHREPIAELGAEGYHVVRHTHDVRRAAGLLRAKLLDDYEYGCPEGVCHLHRWVSSENRFVPTGTTCLHKWDVGKPRCEWIRVVPALPNSYAESEGWAFTYQETEPHARGAFPAVVFQ